MSKLALVMIVKPTDDEALVLDRCLKETAPYVDGIFLTITGENEFCEEIAEKYNAVVSHFTWVKDFAKARNFALAQVPKDFTHWMWLDCDDVPRGIEKLKEVIDENPDVDAFGMSYLYAFDKWGNPVVVHRKARVLKNDGCVEWVGALHEDFSETRQLVQKYVEGIEILHITNEERIKDSTERNADVALKDSLDNPNDPRTYWNLGNALKMAGKKEDSVKAFLKFLETSRSDEEKFTVHLRLAEILMESGDNVKALEEAQKAIGIRWWYPDPFHTAARILTNLKRYTEAVDHFLAGMKLPPPVDSIIVYNPRDYDLYPLLDIAKVYFILNRPDLALPALEAAHKVIPRDQSVKDTIEKLKKEVDKFNKVTAVVTKLKDETDLDKIRFELSKIPDDLQSHPMICSLRNQKIIKETSSGKDLVIFCGFTQEEWSPETAREKGIGGSEEAVIHLAKRFKDKGFNVTVYNNCGHETQLHDGVTYSPFWMWNHRDKQDITILWRHPKAVDYGINSDKIFLDLHDVIPAGELNEARLKLIDKIFVKSQAHRTLFPAVPEEKFAIIPNGIVWDVMQEEKTKRDPMLVINTSSPDRSLSALLDCFAEVKKQVPEAKLQWAYGWRVWDDSHADDSEALKWRKEIDEKIKNTPGVEVLGRLNHGEIAKLYQKAGVFAYPTAFYEIDCISARKAQAGGAFPVTTNFAALNETVQFGDKIKVNPEEENWGKPYAQDFALKGEEARKEWIDACVKRLKTPPSDEIREEMRRWTKRFDWDSIADKWCVMFSE